MHHWKKSISYLTNYISYSLCCCMVFFVDTLQELDETLVSVSKWLRNGPKSLVSVSSWSWLAGEIALTNVTRANWNYQDISISGTGEILLAYSSGISVVYIFMVLQINFNSVTVGVAEWFITRILECQIKVLWSRFIFLFNESQSFNLEEKNSRSYVLPWNN